MKNNRPINNTKRYKEIKKELECCCNILKSEYEKLHEHHLNYSQQVNCYKDISNSIKSKSLKNNSFDEIVSFCEIRNEYLNNELNAIHSYISTIENILSNYDKVDDFIEVEYIDTRLRLMLKSLGIKVSPDVFGEPF